MLPVGDYTIREQPFTVDFDWIPLLPNDPSRVYFRVSMLLDIYFYLSTKPNAGADDGLRYYTEFPGEFWWCRHGSLASCAWFIKSNQFGMKGTVLSLHENVGR